MVGAKGWGVTLTQRIGERKRGAVARELARTGPKRSISLAVDAKFVQSMIAEKCEAVFDDIGLMFWIDRSKIIVI